MHECSRGVQGGRAWGGVCGRSIGADDAASEDRGSVCLRPRGRSGDGGQGTLLLAPPRTLIL